MSFAASVLTLYPEMFPGALGLSLAGRALEAGTWSLEAIQIRDFATDKHRTVDDTPAGGGAGMVMRADVLARAIDHASPQGDPRPRLLMSPRGRQLTQARVRELAAGPWLKPAAGPEHLASVGSLTGSLAQFVTAVYGGFFGAGMGVMMLATLGLTQAGDYHRLNALKNMLSIVIAVVAILVFASGGVVAWLQAIVMIPGVALGGYAGVWIAKRVPQAVVRGFVVAVGLILACYYFTKG